MCGVILLALMKASDHNSFWEEDGNNTLYRIANVHILKKHLRRDTKARECLQNLPTSSPKTFRKALLDCCVSRIMKIEGSFTSKSSKEHSERMQEIVSEYFDDNPLVIGRQCSFCKKHELEDKKLMKCPCRSGKLEILQVTSSFLPSHDCLLISIHTQKFSIVPRSVRYPISKNIKNIVLMYLGIS